MFSRYFFTFGLVVLMAVVASINAEGYEPAAEFIETDYEIQIRSEITQKVRNIIKKAFLYVREHCLMPAVDKCKKYWHSPSEVVQCAKDFFKLENALCLVDANIQNTAAEIELELDYEESSESEIEVRSHIGKKVTKILKSFFKHVTEDCLNKAVDKCKKHWYNPSKVIQCAKDFFSLENAGCLVGA